MKIRPDHTDRPPPADPQLWASVQRLVYPQRSPSQFPPFPQEGSSPSRMPASWLYHELVRDSGLRKQVRL